MNIYLRPNELNEYLNMSEEMSDLRPELLFTSSGDLPDIPA